MLIVEFFVETNSHTVTILSLVTGFYHTVEAVGTLGSEASRRPRSSCTDRSSRILATRELVAGAPPRPSIPGMCARVCECVSVCACVCLGVLRDDWNFENCSDRHADRQKAIYNAHVSSHRHELVGARPN